jgi:hypothetical protein
MFKFATSKDAKKIDSSRALFINGQVVKGNLKPKRVRRRTEVFQRLISRFEVNRIIAEAKYENKD